MNASSLAYTTILSVIPLLAVSLSVFQMFGGMERLYKTIEPLIIENLAQGTDDEAIAMIRTWIGNIHAGKLGTSGAIGLVVTSMSMLFSAEKAINRVWRTELNRSFFSRVSNYWLLITLGPLSTALIVGVATSKKFPLRSVLPNGTVAMVLLFLLFTSIHKWVPHRKVHWVPALSAGFITLLAFVGARIGYGIYTAKILTYSKIYGSLAAIPIVLVWIYLMWVILLTGAALAASFQRRFDLP